MLTTSGHSPASPPLPVLLPRPTTRSSAQCCWAIVQWQIKEKLKASEMKVAQVEDDNDDDEVPTQRAERKTEKILEKNLINFSIEKLCNVSAPNSFISSVINTFNFPPQ